MAGGGCFGLGAAWGIPGVATGMLLAFASTTGLYTWVLSRDLGVSSLTCWLPLTRGLILAVPLGALSWLAGDSHQPSGWLGLLAEMGGWSTLYLIAWYFTAGGDDRREWAALARRLFRR